MASAARGSAAIISAIPGVISITSAMKTIYSAQKDVDDTMRRLRFELNRVHKLSRILGSTVDSEEVMSLDVQDHIFNDLRFKLNDIRRELDDLFDFLSQNESSQRTMRMARSVKYRFKKKEINKSISRIGQSIDSLYLTYASIGLESLHPEIEGLRDHVDKMNVSPEDRFQDQTQVLEWIQSRLLVARSTRSHRSSVDFGPTPWLGNNRSDDTIDQIQRKWDAYTAEHSSIENTWTGPILYRLYTTSIEGLKWIKEILNSTEIDGLIERLQVWGIGLFESPLHLEELLRDERDSFIYFLTGCFARICLNIQIIGITIESQDESDLLYLKELSLLLKGGDERVTIPTITLAEINSDVNMTAEEKLLKYFNNIEDDLDLLYEMLPIIHIARQLYHLPLQTVGSARDFRLPVRDQHRHRHTEDIETNFEVWPSDSGNDTDEEHIEIGEGVVDERTLLLLFDEDINLAHSLAHSLRIQGKEQSAKFEKSPIEATAKLFEAEIDALERWRTERGKRITNEMASIIRRQIEGFQAVDNAALNKMDAKDVRELLESFQNNNKLLQQISTDREKPAEDSKKGPGLKATEAPSLLQSQTTMPTVNYSRRQKIGQRIFMFSRVGVLAPGLFKTAPFGFKHSLAANFPILPPEEARNPNLGKPYTASSPPPSRSPREGSLRERRRSYIV